MWFNPLVIVEFLDGNGQWHQLDDATVVGVASGVYEVTVRGLAAMWLAAAGAFDGMILRLDGLKTPAIVDAKREGDVLVLRALIEPGSPVASS